MPACRRSRCNLNFSTVVFSSVSAQHGTYPALRRTLNICRELSPHPRKCLSCSLERCTARSFLKIVIVTTSIAALLLLFIIRIGALLLRYTLRVRPS